MKSASLFLVYCLIASGLAKPPVFLSYQDSLGQYSFGYSAPGSARSEVRTSNGATRGTYSYVDETGVIQTAQYVADGENGFRVIATNLPQAPLPVQDTPEVMAARTAHLQALELAAKRDEEAQNRDKNREHARKKDIVGNRDASLYKIRGRLGAKIAEIPSNVGERTALENTRSAEPKDSDEILQAVASKSGTDKPDDKSARKEFAGRVSQEIIGGANIPAIPSISSHVPLSQALGQHAVPVFRITYGNYEIQPSAIPESSIAEGAFRVVTPAATILKSATAISTEGAAAPKKKKASSRRTTEQIRTVNPVSLVPLKVAPPSPSYLGIVRYVPSAPLHYLPYNAL